MNEPEEIFSKEYDWESLYDLERDIHETLEEAIEKRGGEFTGNIKVVITYTKEES